MRTTIFGMLAVMAAVTACGDGGGVSAGSAGSGGAGGAGGGAAACEVPNATLQLVFTMPDGRILDSDIAVSELTSASADVTGPASLAQPFEIQVKDEVSGDVAKVNIKGTGGIQLNEGQKARMSLRFAPRDQGGPDAYQIEVIDATTDLLLFAAVKGHIRVFQGMRVSVTLGDETCSSIDQGTPTQSVGAGTGAGHRLKEIVVDAGGGASVAIPSGASADVKTTGFSLNVQNQSAATFVTPPEGYDAVSVTGHVIYPPD
jgi:hypothetical protein